MPCPSSQDVSLMHISGGVSSGSIRLVRKGQREHMEARFPWARHHLLSDSVRALGGANRGPGLESDSESPSFLVSSVTSQPATLRTSYTPQGWKLALCHPQIQPTASRQQPLLREVYQIPSPTCNQCIPVRATAGGLGSCGAWEADSRLWVRWDGESHAWCSYESYWVTLLGPKE